MKTCKDCIHYGWCRYKINDFANNLDICEDFKFRPRFIELTCNYVKFVYFIKSSFSIASTTIKAKIKGIRITSDLDISYEAVEEYSGISRNFYPSNIGESVFLTKEEAEKAFDVLKLADQ